MISCHYILRSGIISTEDKWEKLPSILRWNWLSKPHNNSRTEDQPVSSQEAEHHKSKRHLKHNIHTTPVYTTLKYTHHSSIYTTQVYACKPPSTYVRKPQYAHTISYTSLSKLRMHTHHFVCIHIHTCHMHTHNFHSYTQQSSVNIILYPHRTHSSITISTL